MTTPERLRARQRREGIFLIIIGLLLMVSTFWFQHQQKVDRENFQRGIEAQRECLIKQITALTDTLTARGKLNQADANASTNAILAVAQSTTGAEVRAALDQFVATHEAIAKERKNTPVPPFPSGTCDV